MALSTEAAPWYQQNAPGLIRTIGASYFPIGLVMIMLSGADLFTSNIMFMTVALLHRRVGPLAAARVWAVSFLGNLAGSLAFVAFILGWGGVFDETPYRTVVLSFTSQKVVAPYWHQILLRAVGANWLVCFAVFVSISAREIASKIVAIWMPTATFVALGLDHVIANMTWVPLALWLGHPEISAGLYIWKSLIPTLIGNFLGGGVFVGTAYWYLYLTGEDAVDVHFNVGGIGSAVQEGVGPTDGKVIHGREPEDHAKRLPDSGGAMVSGIGRELSGEKFGKKTESEGSDHTKA